MFSRNQDEVEEQENAINLNEEIPVQYQGWHCGFIEEDNESTIPPTRAHFHELVHSTPHIASAPHVLDAIVPAPIQQQQKVCEIPALRQSKATLS